MRGALEPAKRPGRQEKYPGRRVRRVNHIMPAALLNRLHDLADDIGCDPYVLMATLLDEATIGHVKDRAQKAKNDADRRYELAMKEQMLGRIVGRLEVDNARLKKREDELVNLIRSLRGTLRRLDPKGHRDHLAGSSRRHAARQSRVGMSPAEVHAQAGA